MFSLNNEYLYLRCVPRRLSENALSPQLFVMLKKLSSEYQIYTCGNFFRISQFEKKLLFSDSLLVGGDKGKGA